MAQAPTLKVDGTELPNVLEVKYTVNTTVDRDGRPTMNVKCDGVTIRRIADAKTTLANWAKDPKEKNRKGGEIDFMTDGGKPMKKLTWKNGYVQDYALKYDPAADHVEETVVIQAEQIDCGALKLDLNWPGK